MLFISSSCVQASSKDSTLVCSYICGGTDIYFKLDPITIKDDGSLISQGKVVGKVVSNNADEGEIFAAMGGGATWSLETKKMLSIYTKPLENDVIYNFGSCVRTK